MLKAAKTFLVIVLLFVLVSWGSTGHYIISNNSALSFNSEMEQFQSWATYLADHASDADNRKRDDPSEAPKHYIDIDNYPEFINSGYIPQTLSEAITLHGYYNVYDWGILPWATKATYDSLKNCFARMDWDKAKYFAADLGHYVADGHMPLHITSNYDGQLTGNDGIHSRYESTMINGHSSEIVYSGSEIQQISNVTQYILNYLYYNNKYVDSVLIADNYAKSLSSNYSSTVYKDALWNGTKDFTIMLFSNASHALTELIYTAWKEAGSPSLTGVEEIIPELKKPFTLNAIYPNPCSQQACIAFTTTRNVPVEISVFDITGKRISQLANKEFTPGTYKLYWESSEVPQGIYLIKVKSNSLVSTSKVIVAR